MKKIFIVSLFIISAVSCSTTYLFRDTISINELLAAKDKIDRTENPAESFLLKNSLAENVIAIDNLKVMSIVQSTNVDYDFCIISDMQTDKGPVQFYIYTKNIRRISQLKKGESIIDVKGEFSRFFSMLDNYYIKIEIVNAAITIK